MQSTESFDGIDTNSLQKIFLALGGYQHESFWYSWWFSDEPTIDRTDGDYTKWSFYGSGERLHRDKLQPRRRPLRYSQMFFGAINYDKPSRIVPLESDPPSGWGGVTGRRILACLQSYLPGLIEEGETFQHDNARTFKAKIVQEWLRHWARRHGVSLTDWPPYSLTSILLRTFGKSRKNGYAKHILKLLLIQSRLQLWPGLLKLQKSYEARASPTLATIGVQRLDWIHPPLTPLGMSSPSHCNGAPQLVRASTTTANTGSNTSYHPISLYSVKAVLKIEVNATCQSVSVNERPTNSICISCIWWAEKGECYVTSVDTIHLLEQLIAAPNRFSVKEKNRIRRNLEGFHSQTVSKAKPDSEGFFKVIMGFPNPKPRNIEKDVKVFPWKILESAIQKIIGKYSVNPSTLAPPPMMNQSNGGYAPLLTRPGQNMALAHPDADAHTQYPFPQHHNSIPSCRLQLSPQSS
ncbi:hypothetical protein FOXG_17052 [Fusarium oxysporum f. sp. lycopersici 4287]|uniref:DUF7082 domain-containing protein n=3 Tax=Fusarium oxysporum TaxID=5507 RepID=A0A0J9VXB8_FUSO4|nr:hypothetical protein FOXG_13967 [Fusarium oxysporum f. sp. lycopersici 4287]XP_018257910.1 hypothetical protein FOXG_17052 [Fusarium oxysporum f. sp. lycopersici 4287]KNB15401.1 hypothetical protein FOXG_13967 [Fusarium oxysporum f. sp. lycopersici 4287]KNB19865.1 hypothetical protein FOXG_17052 [Fusarium oxysporum f. sp. lycopersici 4287]